MSVFGEKNYWALILGASSGMGLATAHKLAKEGMNVALVYRERRTREEEVAQEIETMEDHGVEILACNTDALNDLKRQEVLSQLQDKVGLGRVRVLLHSIAKGNLKLMTPAPSDEAISYPAQLLETTDFAMTSDSMAFSLVPWLNDLVSMGIQDTNMRILTLTSAGDDRIWRGYAAVATAKAALEALTKYIAVEYAHLGLTANVIEAGVTITPSMQLIPGSEVIIEKAASQHPKGRLTQPEDVANVVSLLCRDEANWINGSRLVVDGGERLL
ncbi:MAG: SDR family oxidoreductase [Bacteroidota bacterium]